MDPPQREDSSGLADAVDRERLGRLVASRQAQQPISAISGRSTSKWTHLPLVLAVSFLALAASGFLFYLLGGRQAVSSDKSNANTSYLNSRPSYPPESVKHGMIAIPGGTFRMGRDDGPPQERPSHNVVVRDFLLDSTEITNEEYAEFVRNMNYEVPSHWVGGKPVTGQERWPVVNVSPKDAEAFAAWRSKRDGVTYRLPTEEEWEFAARNGGEYKSYPWGDTWEERRAVVKEAAPRSVGTYPEGKNRWGVVDLIGNVWEWTSSEASLYTGTSAIPAATRDWVVARGGSYASDPASSQIPISATYRDWFEPTLKHPNFGFRLARSGQ